MSPIERVAVIGAGPAGAITVDALAQEKTFRVIRGFERREGPGGCWIGDTSPPGPLPDVDALAQRTADQPVAVPATLPARTAAVRQARFAESSVYPYLETNVDARAMEYTQEPFPTEASAWSVATYGPDTPFRPWTAVRGYVQGLLARRGYETVFSYNTTVERVEKADETPGRAAWKLTLRRPDGADHDVWWAEWFDAVVVASGHYAVPYVPAVAGLAAAAAAQPGRVLHSKQYRGRAAFAGRRVVVVGASVSAADIAADLVGTAQAPVHVVVDGHTPNGYFGDAAFQHPGMARHPSVAGVAVDGDDAEGRLTVTFEDGAVVPAVDALVFGTGYSWTLPFLAPLRPAVPNAARGQARVPGLFQHVVWRHDPTLLFVGAVNAGLTFKIFEWQAVFAARLLAGRLAQPLPAPAAMAAWEDERLRTRGDGPRFHLVFPDFEEYFETLRRFAGAGDGGKDGVGRVLPPFDREWFRLFMAGHERRKAMWRRNNAAAAAKKTAAKAETADAAAKTTETTDTTATSTTTSASKARL